MQSKPQNDCKVFGDIPGVPVGMLFRDRQDLWQAGVHGRTKWGIHGNREEGGFSVVLNGGYEDDEDHGETIIYTGHGKGHDKNGRPGSENGPQIGDQEWHYGNFALKESVRTEYPVRVIRGPDAGDCAPVEGYRYDGLYDVVRAWKEKGKEGFMVCRFELRRTTAFPQDPLPGPHSPIGRWWHRRNMGRSSFSSHPPVPGPSRPSGSTPTRRSSYPGFGAPTYVPPRKRRFPGRQTYHHLGPIPKDKSSILPSDF